MFNRLMAIRARRRAGREGEQGQILVLFCLVIVVIMLAASLVIDVGLLRTDGARLQNALDAGSLAAAQSLPATAANAAAIKGVANQFTRDNFNGPLAPSNPDAKFRCIVGVNQAGTGPRNVDIPAVCNVPYAVTDPIWECTAAVCWAPCGYIGTSTTWRTGDVCNAIELSVSTTRQYTFGRIQGINEGSTGVLTSVACTGPCGGIQYEPVDVALVIDRTLSMDPNGANERNSGSDLGGHADFTPQLRSAARAVLQAYDPAIQHVSLGMLGPTDTRTGQACSNGATGKVLPYVEDREQVAYESDSSATNTGSAGQNYLQVDAPSGVDTNDVLVAVVTVDGLPAATTVTPTRNGTFGYTNDNDWRLIGTRQDTTGTPPGLTQLAYYKVITSSNDYNTYRFSWGSTNLRATGGIIRFSGVDTANPIGDTSARTGSTTSATTTAGRTMTANGVAGNRYGALLALFSVDAETSVGTWSGSLTEQFDVNRNTNPDTSPTTAAATRELPDADENSNKTALVANGTPNGTAWIGRQIELNPIPFVGYDPSASFPYSTANRPTWIPVPLTGTPDLAGQGAAINESYVNPTTGVINEASQIVRSIDCILRPNALTRGTDLATPMDFAWRYLTANVRHDPDTGDPVTTGIIFETDGRPQLYDFSCAAANAAATAAKNAGVEVFTIAFVDPDDDHDCPDASGTWRNKKVISLLAAMSSPREDGAAVITATNPEDCSDLDTTENSDGDNFFCVDTGHPADLTDVFRRAAQQLSKATRLVQVYATPIVTSVSPRSARAGTSVTITGKYFREVSSVTFGGNPATFTVNSDTSITAQVPAGAGTNVQVKVVTPGGPSRDTSADDFTWLP